MIIYLNKHRDTSRPYLKYALKRLKLKLSSVVTVDSRRAYIPWNCQWLTLREHRDTGIVTDWLRGSIDNLALLGLLIDSQGAYSPWNCYWLTPREHRVPDSRSIHTLELLLLDSQGACSPSNCYWLTPREHRESGTINVWSQRDIRTLELLLVDS